MALSCAITECENYDTSLSQSCFFFSKSNLDFVFHWRHFTSHQTSFFSSDWLVEDGRIYTSLCEWFQWATLFFFPHLWPRWIELQRILIHNSLYIPFYVYSEVSFNVLNETCFLEWTYHCNFNYIIIFSLIPASNYIPKGLDF